MHYLANLNVFKHDLVDAFEQFLEVLLNTLGLLGVTEDFDQVFVRQEVKSGEVVTLAF